MRCVSTLICFICLVCSGTPARAQDLDPSGGIIKPKASAPPRYHRERPKPKPKPKPKPDPGDPDPEPEPDEEHVPPAEALEHYDAGNAAYDRNDLEKAVDEYEAAIRLDGKFLDAFLELGRAYYDLSDLDQALDTWQRALYLDKSIPELHNNIANISYVRRDFEKAIAEYNKAIELRPGYYEALFGLGNTLMALKRYDEAIPYFQRAIDTRGVPFPDARSNMAWAMLRAGHLDEAEVAARKAIEEIGPDKVSGVKAWYGLAAVLTEKRDYKGAADALRKAIEICDGCSSDQIARIYYSLATILEADGDRAGAANALDEYLRLAPYVTNINDVRRKIDELRSGA